jgi:hypothetical protein
VESLFGPVKSNLDQLAALIEALPDALWAKSAGGWPAWQHVVHAIGASDLFTSGPATPPPAGLAPETIQLKSVGAVAPDKAAVKGYLAAVRSKVEAHAAALDDEALSRPNEATAAIGLPWNQATTLSILASHAAYHVGHGDALLRLEGLPGVF